LKNNTEVTNRKCYVLFFPRFCAYFFTSNFKKDDRLNIWPHLKFFSPHPRLCWVGYGPADCGRLLWSAPKAFKIDGMLKFLPKIRIDMLI